MNAHARKRWVTTPSRYLRPPTHNRPLFVPVLTISTKCALGAIALALPALLLSGAGTAQADEPCPPEKCKKIPTDPILGVEWTPWPGGITATVHMLFNFDDAPVGCLYRTDGYQNRFALTDDEPHDVVITPAVPLNRWWPVDVSCDNGVNLQTGTWY